MIALFILCAALAIAASAITGWSLAARVAARERAAAAADASDRVRATDGELEAAREATLRLEEEVEELRTKLAAATRAAELSDGAMRSALDDRARAIAQVTTLKTEVAGLRDRMVADQTAGRARETNQTVAEVQRVLAPLLERERLGKELARVELGRGTRGELPRMLEAIARIGDFSSVILSDERGLPLAAGRGGDDDERLAGLWSMLLSIAERLGMAGLPVPTAVVVHDAANQTILHRLFSSAGSRFLLTAVGRGRALGPETLDPALDKLERVLAGSALAAG